MIGNYELMNFFVEQELTNAQMVLLAVSMSPEEPKQTKTIQEKLVSLGVNHAKTWNISDILGKQKKICY